MLHLSGEITFLSVKSYVLICVPELSRNFTQSKGSVIHFTGIDPLDTRSDRWRDLMDTRESD